jgi:RHS repeat-associated protein
VAGNLTGIDAVTLSRDAVGNLLGTSGAGCDLTMAYDALNRLTSITDGWGNTVDFDYDAVGNTVRITYAPDLAVNYTYDVDNRLASMADWNGRVTTYSYRPDGLVSQVSNPNGTSTSYAYDGAGRVTGIAHVGPGGVIANYVYNLDNLGNHTGETVSEPLGLPELVSASRLSTINSSNQLTSITGTSFGYDGNGNLSTVSGDRNLGLTYDEENRLASLTGDATANYLYDVFGNRRQSLVDGITKRYVLDPRGMSRVLCETNGAGVPLAYYVWGLGLVSRIYADGTTHYYHGNNVGSVVAMTNGSGTVSHAYSYDPFGNLVAESADDPNPFTFAGLHGVMRDQAGMYYMRARYYDPIVGRFLGEDPIWNRDLYSYANSNPLRFVDSDGLRADSPAIDLYAEAFSLIKTSMDLKGRLPLYLAERVTILLAEWTYGQEAALPDMSYSSLGSEFIVKFSGWSWVAKQIGFMARSTMPGGKYYENVDRNSPKTRGERWNEKVAGWLSSNWLGRY